MNARNIIENGKTTTPIGFPTNNNDDDDDEKKLWERERGEYLLMIKKNVEEQGPNQGDEEW